MRRLAVLVVLLLLPIITGCANNLFYYPTRVDYGTPAQYGAKYEEVMFKSRDGVSLHGWFMPAAGRARGTVIHFHGNAQNISSHVAFVAWLPAEGFNVFTFDYRGYGQSAGSVSREGVYQDSLAAIDYVRSRPDVDAKRLVVLGQSLGGAVAIAAVAGSNADGIRAVVVDSAFSSYRSIARDAISGVPVISWFRWPASLLMVSGSHDPDEAIAKIAPRPLLLVHGTADRVIPWQHSIKLYESAGSPKDIMLLDGAGHAEAFARPGPMRKRLVEFYAWALDGAGVKQTARTEN